SGSEDATVRQWDLETGRELFCLRVDASPKPEQAPRPNTILRLEYLPGARALISSDSDRMVRLWDLKTGRGLRNFQQSGSVTATAVLPDGRLLVGDAAGKVGVMDVERGKERPYRWRHPHGVLGVAVSADGRRAVSVDGSGVVSSWDVQAGDVRGSYKPHL